ncbi:WD40 repeat domain-containing protein [Nostoc sp. 'Peltigera membranacea cyanobiont' 232]|uniref:WD40 repeat domain-containing protein n=1 Tax=Nostoc sp. 'Peltigera membranacea cyanobiont' 232 TaxID=2014531 RepID=UPI000B9516EA|nr:WD40 repeat domain-containing protein [Nostoc sp. 'Peltigera membranacea cyanobiont' 232]OYE03375.1 peptidase C14 [Nostoc sp. 'Peltigera membranacea cyanobiont' 232]
MAEENSNYNSKFENEVKSAVVGEKNIIYNYFYYREEARVEPVDPAIAADEYLPCPYQGLFHFGPNDADVFFGREIFIEELYSATKTNNFIPVLGASGSGKSSVVLAGLVPKLQKAGHWQFTHFRPGSDPFHALALALVPLYTPKLDQTDQIAQARKMAGYLQDGSVILLDVFAKIQQNHPNHRVLLIADQFEEIYTLCNDQEIRRKFLDCLLVSLETLTSLTSSATVLVTTMRADFLGNALSYRPFADVLQNGDVKLGPMNREELTQVIEKPAQKFGVTFADGLVKRILDDVENQPGNLPLLEFALTELWNKRTGKQLTHKIYEEIGQVEGALARHADEKYGNLTDDEKEKVRRIFIQLVRPGEGAEDTRRIAMKAELGEQSWSLVKKLADARLVVTSRNLSSQETVEVVHEALIRNWGELREWMNTNRVFRAWQERLRSAKGQWEATNKDSGSLLRGAALAVAEEKLKERPEDLIDEKEFIEQSIQEGNRLKQAEAARRKREIRTAWGIAAGSLVAVVISGGLGFTAWNETKQAQLNLAESLGRYSLSLFNEHKSLEAFVPAIRAGKILQSQHKTNSEVMNALQTVRFQGRERNSLEGHSNAVNSVSFSPDGKTLASGSGDKTIKLWNLETGKEIHTLTGHSNAVASVSFSPDGKTLASGSLDKTIKLWNLETGKEIRTLNGHSSSVTGVSFSPDGKTLASSSGDKTIKLWNLETGKEIRTLTGHSSSVTSVSFSPDGKTLASGSGDKTIKLWNLETGKEIRTLTGHSNYVASVSFSPDGKTLASGSLDNRIKLWNLETGKEIRTLTGHSFSVTSLSFSPDGKTLASGSLDNRIKLWNLETGKEIRTLTGHSNIVNSVSFSPDGKTLASGSGDYTIKLWNLETGKEIRALMGHSLIVFSVSFSPDGKTLASGSWDKTIKLWNLETGKEIRTLTGHSLIVNSVSFSPDGKTLASSSADKTIKLWNLETGKEIRALTGHSNYVASVSFSPDGKTLASGSADKTIKLWNLETGKEIRALTGHSSVVNSVSFSPDGKTLASGSDDNTIKFWNLETGKEIRTLTGHSNYVASVSFSPDGKTLASGSADKTIKLWNLETGKEIHTLTGHSSVVFSVSFSPDGKTLASGSGDYTIKLWNLETGKEIHTLTGHSNAVFSVSFSPDGKTLASGSADNTIKLWNIPELESKLKLDSLMQNNCDSVRVYLENNPNVSERDSHLCDAIGRK